MPHSAPETNVQPDLAYLLVTAPASSSEELTDEIGALAAHGLHPMVFSLYGDSGESDTPTYCLEPTPSSFWVRLRAHALYMAFRPVSFVRMWLGLLGADSAYYWRLAWYALPWVAVLETSGVAHVHCRLAADNSSVAWMLHRLSGVSYSVSVGGRDLSNRLLEERLSDAEFVVSPGQAATEAMLKRFPRVKRVIASAPGVDLDRFRRTQPYRAARPFRVVSIGRLLPRNGHAVLIEAIRIMRVGGMEVECRIIGEGALKGELEEAVSKADLDDRVRLVGRLSPDDVRRELEEASVFAMPSVVSDECDGLDVPMALKNAMAMELPVVVSDTAGHREAVDTTNGMLVPGEDATAMAEALSTLASMALERLRTMGLAGRERIMQSYDQGEHLLDLAKEFQRLSSQA
jgi:colanic acid/amylovoran biosynthesis glycosyltransferase